MKKILALLLACVMVFSLTACGGSKDEAESKADSNTEAQETESTTEEPEEEVFRYVWYDADMPETFEQDETDIATFTNTEDTDQVIKVYVNSNTFKTAEVAKQESIDFWDDGSHTDEGTMEAAGLTWYVEGFTWNDDRASYKYYADVDDNSYLEIDMFCIDRESDIATNFFDSFKTVDTDDLYNTSIELLYN